MPNIAGRDHGAFYGHGTLNKKKVAAWVPEGKELWLYGPKQTTLADEVAKYVILYLQNHHIVAPLVSGDLGLITSLQMEQVQSKRPRLHPDTLSPLMWKAATPLNSYPQIVKAHEVYNDITISLLNNVSIYNKQPRFVTVFDRDTSLSQALANSKMHVLHLLTCQATKFSDDLVILNPEKSNFAFNTSVKIEIEEEEEEEESLEDLYRRKGLL